MHSPCCTVAEKLRDSSEPFLLLPGAIGTGEGKVTAQLLFFTQEVRNLNKLTMKQRMHCCHRLLEATPATFSQAVAVAEGVDHVRTLHQHEGQFYLSLLSHAMFSMVILINMLFVMLLEMFRLEKKNTFLKSSSLPLYPAFLLRSLHKANLGKTSYFLKDPYKATSLSLIFRGIADMSCFLVSLFSLSV